MENEVELPSEYYKNNVGDRSDYEKRAEDIAKISLPYLIRTDSATGGTAMDYSPSQSFNGMLINNLKAKIGMALLPPRTSSFRFQPDPQALLEFTQDNQAMNEEIYKELSFKQDAVNQEIERQQIRSSIFDLAGQIIGVGPVIMEKVKKAGLQMHTLKNIVVSLDNMGEPYQMCFMEILKVLPQGFTVEQEKENYELYTMAKYDFATERWVVTQDIDGEPYGEEMTYSDDELPYKYIGWTWMPGDSYHRPFAEDYYPDMQQIDNLSRLNTDGAVVAAKILLFVNQRGGRTRKADVANTVNGDIVDGSSDDVTAFQLQKNFDFQVSNDREDTIKRELQKAFLDTGSVTRDAERVTAEEIRVMTQQLESSTLAGIYSKMSLSLSKWIVEMIMKEIGIKFEAIDVDVLTGLDALGRSSEAQKLDAFVQRAIATNTRHYIKDSELLNRYASYDSVSTTNLLKTEAEVQKEVQEAQQREQQQALAMSAANTAGQEGVRALGQGASQQQ